MDRVRARTPNPYERDKLHRMKRQTTNRRYREPDHRGWQP